MSQGDGLFIKNITLLTKCKKIPFEELSIFSHNVVVWQESTVHRDIPIILTPPWHPPSSFSPFPTYY